MLQSPKRQICEFAWRDTGERTTVRLIIAAVVACLGASVDLIMDLIIYGKYLKKQYYL